MILANINTTVILENLASFQQHLTVGGVLIVSGFLIDDEAELRINAEKTDLGLIARIQRENWLCLEFKKTT